MLPRTLEYGSRVQASPARSTRVSVQPQNGTGPYNRGEVITFNLPTRRNLVLAQSESYLKFNLVVTNGSTAAANFRFDSCGAHGLFQSLRVTHGSNLLENEQNYGLLAKLCMDNQVSQSASGKQSIFAGARSDIPVVGTAATPLRTGAVVASSLAAATASTAKTYCLPLISILGTLGSQYIPLFEMTAAPLTLDLTLVDSIMKAMGCVDTAGGTTVSASTFQLSNVEFVATIIELADESINIIRGAQEGQPVQMVIPSWTRYSNTIPAIADNATYNIPIPAQFASLRSIFVAMRDKVNTVGFFSHSCVTYNVASYTFMVGAQQYPPKAPNTIPEFYAENVKAWATIGDLEYNPAINYDAYSLNASAAMTATAAATSYEVKGGSFCIGLDLESYAGAAKDRLFAGCNTLTDQLTWIPVFGTVPTAGVAIQVDVYALHDSVLVCENGTAYLRW